MSLFNISLMSLKLREHHSYVSLITYHKMTPKSTLECLLAYKEEFNPRFVLEHRTPVMPARNPIGFRKLIIRESLANLRSVLKDSSRHQTWRTRRRTRILRRRERAVRPMLLLLSRKRERRIPMLLRRRSEPFCVCGVSDCFNVLMNR